MRFNAKLVFGDGLEHRVPLNGPDARVTLTDYSVRPPREISVQGKSDGNGVEVFVSRLVRNKRFTKVGRENPYVISRVKNLGSFGIGETYIQHFEKADGTAYELHVSYPELAHMPDIATVLPYTFLENNLSDSTK